MDDKIQVLALVEKLGWYSSLVFLEKLRIVVICSENSIYILVSKTSGQIIEDSIIINGWHKIANRRYKVQYKSFDRRWCTTESHWFAEFSESSRL